MFALIRFNYSTIRHISKSSILIGFIIIKIRLRFHSMCFAFPIHTSWWRFLIERAKCAYSSLNPHNHEASRHLQRWCPLYSIIEEWKSSFLELLVMSFLFLEGGVNNLRIFPEKSGFVNDPSSESTFPYYIFITFSPNIIGIGAIVIAVIIWCTWCRRYWS